MGTKNNPGTYDCYAKADPDEPIFTLRANDPTAADIVSYWIELNKDIQDREKLYEAEKCMWDMRDWRNNNKKER